MKKTTLEEFRKILTETGEYHSDETKLPARQKPSRWNTFRYCWDCGSVFPKCAVYEGCRNLDTDKWAHFCFHSVSGAERMGVKVHVDGWNVLKTYDGPVMFLCNHMSTVETVMLPAFILTYKPFNVVVKESLTRLPFLKTAAAHMGLVPIGRKSPKQDLLDMIRISTERITEQKNSFLIFPQGTRSRVFSRAKFSSIGAKIAEKAGCPIVPIAVDTRIMPTRTGTGLIDKVFKDFGTVDPSFDLRCSCGPIIPCTKAKEMHEATFNWIANKLEEWGCPTER